ncbi:MAG: mandelate racemase [Candidatus Omnitrophica bacterium]|nr:mandelate racemase [Candidatus Omnitrophota bacterium]
MNRITGVEIIPLRYPTVGRFKFFESPSGPPGRAAVLVKIVSEDGTTGWGQSVPVPRWSYETLESAVSALERYLAPLLVGIDPLDLDAVHTLLNREIAGSFSTGAPITKAGIDLALHDLIGKALGKNVRELWGRTGREEITLSWTLNPKNLEDLEPMIEEGRRRGYEHFNVKVAPDPVFDLEMCRIVKRCVPEGFLWCDANGGYDLKTALDVAPQLADIGVPVLEQPLPANRLSGYQALKRQGALPIVMDEGVVSPEDLVEFYRLGCLDGVAMKPARCGGLLSARRQVEILESEGLMFLGSGLTDPDLSLAASLNLYGAYNLQHPAALNGPQFLVGSLLSEPLAPEGGKLRVPKGPGLGVSVEESRMEALRAV